MRKHLFSLMIVGCVIFCIVLALDLLPILRGGFGWQWAYFRPELLRLLPLLICAAVYTWGLFRIQNIRVYQLWCFVGTIILVIAALYVKDDPLDLLTRRTLGGWSSGEHLAGAAFTNLLEAARTWPQIMRSYYSDFGLPGVTARPFLAMHIGTNPPGLPIMFYGLNQFLGTMPGIADALGMPLRFYVCKYDIFATYSNAQMASAWLMILLPVWSAFTVFPLYRLGGKYAAGWWPLIPSMAFFTPLWHVIYPLIALIAYMSLRTGVTDLQSNRSRGIFYVILAGILVSITTFTAFACVPLIGFFGLYILFSFVKWWKVQNVAIKPFLYRMLLAGLIFTLSALSIWLIYYLVSGVTLYDVLHAGLDMHFGLNRPYFPYLFLNLYDLALFTGIPLVLIALSAIKWPRLWAEIDPMALALIVTLLIMTNIGRGETGRQWSYFIPFILILAAQQATRLSSRRILAVSLLQALTFCTVTSFLIFFGPDLKPAVQPAFAQPATDSLPAPVKFGDYLTLLGTKAVPEADGINLSLLWRVDKQMTIPYSFSALVLDSNGQLVSDSHVFQPYGYDAATYFPTTCWRPDDTYTHTEHIPLKTGLSPATYWISFAVLDIRNLDRLPVRQPDHPVDNQVGLGPIEVH